MQSSDKTPNVSQDITIEVVYAEPGVCHRRTLNLPSGTVAGDAVRASGLTEACPSIAQDRKLGVFSQRVDDDHVLREGDRVEIYRALTLTPTEARRLRARRRKEKALALKMAKSEDPQSAKRESKDKDDS